MNKGTGALLAVVGIIVVLIIFFVGGYNSLVSKQTAVEEQAANIDTQLQRRADLIPNLVKTVKSFAEHETAVFDEVNKAREKLMSAGTMAEKSEANEEVTGALNKLIAIAESYPELKSDTVYVDLMDELAGTENRISYARQNYNAAAASYNKAIRMFPGALFAGMFGFEKAELFEAAEGAEKVPDVDL
ncbi:MAG: LemA family protein [Lachnospiraceae bacterium]|nr:LemA family protein [Lachnospiraceae bacterium]